MSVKVMGQVWELDLPHQEVLVLLAMADHADHEGRHVRPSLALLAWKTHYSKRQVIRIIQALEVKRLIRVRKAGGGRGKATEYTLHLENGVKKSPFRNDDMVTPFGDEYLGDMPASARNSDKQNSVMVAPFVNDDMVTPFVTDNSSQEQTETVTFATQNSDTAMSPKPSLEPKEDLTPLPIVPPPFAPLLDGEMTTMVQMEDSMAASYNQPLKDDAKTVLAYLNAATGRTYTYADTILALLRRGVTAAQCKGVIDWWKHVKTVRHPDQDEHFNASTPFKPDLFDNYLAAAVEWQTKGRTHKSTKAAATNRPYLGA
jgi:Helix-turn-helix domain/Conserved phage C-terminus (Phg_2220_C)